MKTPKLTVERELSRDGRYRFRIYAGERQIAFSGLSYPDTDDGLYRMSLDIALLVPGTVPQKPVPR